MKNITPFNVYPSLPKNIRALEKIVNNIYWTWDHDSVTLFLRIDRELWESTHHNPVLMLGMIDQEKLEELSNNDSFVAHVARIEKRLDDYLNGETWYSKNCRNGGDSTIAYFSFEYGITECLEIYSGGLGMLAGDHLKSASDLGLPLVGVGLLYQEGYFRQYLNIDGWQQESYPKNDFYNLPITLERDENGNPKKIGVEYPGRTVFAQIWKAQVGRVPLYLMDTNIPENSPKDRGITYQLYGGDKETRAIQEIMLGIGGLRVLEALDIYPDVCHMNEGHAAFLAIQRLIQVIKDNGGASIKDALGAVKAGCVFTTHTPVPAGIDMFSPKLITPYLEIYANVIGIPVKELLALGRMNPDDNNEEFNMAFFAIRMSSYCNGVSRLHGEVSRKIWDDVWPGITAHEVPISSVTNGVHAPSWISHDLANLFNTYLGTNWQEEQTDKTLWEHINQIPSEELWNTHERRRERLVAFARKKLKRQLERRGASPYNIEKAANILDPSALTIGFARRFATYKRANLLLKDPDRLRKILLNKKYPVQIIFAGKAHPADEEGKKLIRDIIHFSRDPEIRRRIVFLENYNITLARYLVSGVDVWLNTPKRPMEASGTSGMKAMLNGVLNCSILDGWWVEAFEMAKNVGWAIGSGEHYDDPEYQDKVESNDLYNLLEKEIAPIFYKRGIDRIPWEWIEKMKNTMMHLSHYFNTDRMVTEYNERFYTSTAERFRHFSENKLDFAKTYRKCYERIGGAWDGLKIKDVKSDVKDGIYVNGELEVRAKVELGELTPDDVDVQIYYGQLDSEGNIVDGDAVSMDCEEASGKNSVFMGKVKSNRSGRHGYTLRILPKCYGMIHPYEWYLIHWL
ncbi:MAG: glycosyltransferase family 1 protein [bacterium]|nr:glycosyltransferase family 1 protein [bacterium]